MRQGTDSTYDLEPPVVARGEGEATSAYDPLLRLEALMSLVYSYSTLCWLSARSDILYYLLWVLLGASAMLVGLTVHN